MMKTRSGGIVGQKTAIVCLIALLAVPNVARAQDSGSTSAPGNAEQFFRLAGQAIGILAPIATVATVFGVAETGFGLAAWGGTPTPLGHRLLTYGVLTAVTLASAYGGAIAGGDIGGWFGRQLDRRSSRGVSQAVEALAK